MFKQPSFRRRRRERVVQRSVDRVSPRLAGERAPSTHPAARNGGRDPLFDFVGKRGTAQGHPGGKRVLSLPSALADG